MQDFPEQVQPGSWVDALVGWRGPWRGLEPGVRTQNACGSGSLGGRDGAGDGGASLQSILQGLLSPSVPWNPVETRRSKSIPWCLSPCHSFLSSSPSPAGWWLGSEGC